METKPRIIQGGMGASISNWKLARAVSLAGQMGVVSGTALASIFARRLQVGDEGGHLRRAVKAFPIPEIANNVMEKYYRPDGLAEDGVYKRHPMYTINSSPELLQLTVVGSFVEVWLAKEGHDGLVGVNVLEKIQLPNLATLYGSMLADVDFVIIGAGIPLHIPGALDLMVTHEATSIPYSVIGAERGDDFRIHFDPKAIGFEGLPDLKRPNFYAIISSNVLATAMIKRATGRVDGFIVETPTAGGHNAPPRGPLKLNEIGEPIYGEKDIVDLEKLCENGLPFWMAGSYGSPEQLDYALEHGAEGIQVGTAFAFCDDSGMDTTDRLKVVELAKQGNVKVFTDPKASPTGFPFKVVTLKDSLYNDAVYQQRDRICDLGFLRNAYKKEDGKLGYRCASEPKELYVKKGGKIEDCEGRKCLCNALCTAAGFPQMTKSGRLEPTMITSGDEVVNIPKFIPEGQETYSAQDVINRLLRVT